MRCQECDSKMEEIFQDYSGVVYWCHCGCVCVENIMDNYKDKWYIHTCYVGMD